VFVVSPVTWVEMDTAALLKSEIGEGRRRLLFREAVAAIIYLSGFQFPASLLSLSVHFSSLLHTTKTR
jgi:hypothetical protein